MYYLMSHDYHVFSMMYALQSGRHGYVYENKGFNQQFMFAFTGLAVAVDSTVEASFS